MLHKVERERQHSHCNATPTAVTEEQGDKEDNWVLKHIKQQQPGENCIMRCVMIYAPHQ
jgi:dolichyl-phosphate-mannose--protein O-mannosyl transferase